MEVTHDERNTIYATAKRVSNRSGGDIVSEVLHELLLNPLLLLHAAELRTNFTLEEANQVRVVPCKRINAPRYDCMRPYYMCVCVCLCGFAHVCARMCVCTCVFLCVRDCTKITCLHVRTGTFVTACVFVCEWFRKGHRYRLLFLLRFGSVQ